MEGVMDGTTFFAALAAGFAAGMGTLPLLRWLSDLKFRLLERADELLRAREAARRGRFNDGEDEFEADVCSELQSFEAASRREEDRE